MEGLVVHFSLDRQPPFWWGFCGRSICDSGALKHASLDSLPTPGTQPDEGVLSRSSKQPTWNDGRQALREACHRSRCRAVRGGMRGT